MPLIDEMVLSDEKIADITKSGKSFGTEWTRNSLRFCRVHLYIATFLDKEEVSFRSRMCYREGVDRYSRKDGQPITEEDITAIRECSYGQGSVIKEGKAGDLSVLHDWFIDSSD